MKNMFGILMISVGIGWSAFASGGRADLRPLPVVSVAGSEVEGSRAERLQLLLTLHNQRFDSEGSFIESDEKTSQFDRAQESFIALMRAQGALHSMVAVGNDFSQLKSEFFRASALVDEHGGLLALVMEKRSYKNTFARSILRVFSVENLRRGQVLLGAMDKAVLRGRVSQDEAGDLLLSMSFIKNFRKQEMMSSTFRLAQVQGRWTVIDPANLRPIRKAFVISWISIISFNGGVRELLLDSRESLDHLMEGFE